MGYKLDDRDSVIAAWYIGIFLSTDKISGTALVLRLGAMLIKKMLLCRSHKHLLGIFFYCTFPCISVHGTVTITGFPSGMYLHLIRSIFWIDSGFTMTLTRIKTLLTTKGKNMKTVNMASWWYIGVCTSFVFQYTWPI